MESYWFIILVAGWEKFLGSALAAKFVGQGGVTVNNWRIDEH
jgi:hypothetical protein